MATEQEPMMGYGYATDEAPVRNIGFGINKAKLIKFEYTPTGGKDGAAQDALDIVFLVGYSADNKGVEISARKFPISKVYNKSGGEITDTTSQEYKDAMATAFKDFGAFIVHILHAFQDDATVRAGLGKPAASFKDYCNNARNVLPQGFDTKELDIFLGYQYTISSGQPRTYLEVPKKMQQGKWLVPHVEGTFTEIRMDNPDDKIQDAIKFGKEETATTDEVTGVKTYTEFHPFKKSGWFAKSNYANQQTDKNTSSGASPSASYSAANSAIAGNPAPATVGTPDKDAW